MRSHGILLLLGAIAAIAGTMASPALARSSRSTPLYATTVTMQFVGPSGKTRTIKAQVSVDAGHGCPGPGFASAEQDQHPDLAGMTLKSMTCGDSAGGSRPGGPAIVLLKFVTDGKLKTAVVDHQGATGFDMKTCPFLLQKNQDALVAQVQGRFPGGKFVGASCMARPKFLNSFTNSIN